MAKSGIEKLNKISVTKPMKARYNSKFILKRVKACWNIFRKSYFGIYIQDVTKANFCSSKCSQARVVSDPKCRVLDGQKIANLALIFECLSGRDLVVGIANLDFLVAQLLKGISLNNAHRG